MPYWMRQAAFQLSCINRASVFEWHKRFKEGRESVRDDERCGRSNDVRTPEFVSHCRVSKEYDVEALREFRKRFRRKRPALFKSAQWHFHLDNAPVHKSILVTVYLSKMGIKQFLSLPTVHTLLPVTFGYSLTIEIVFMRQIRRWKRLWRRSLTRSHMRGLPLGLPEVFWTVQQVHWSRRRLLRRGLKFHVCTINKSSHTKKVWKLIVCSLYFASWLLFCHFSGSYEEWK